MQDKLIRILLVESDAAESDRIAAIVASAQAVHFSFRLRRVSRIAEAVLVLADLDTDVVLLDLVLPDAQGYDTFVRIRDATHGRPILVLADRYDETLSSMVVGSGAQDFLIKGRLDGHMLVNAIQYSIQRHCMFGQVEQRLKDVLAAEAQLRALMLGFPDGMLVVDQQNMLRFVNPAAAALLGSSPEALIGSRLAYRVTPGEPAAVVDAGVAGSMVLELRATEAQWELAPASFISVRDVTERTRAEQEVRASEERFRLAAHGAQQGIWDWDLAKQRMHFGAHWAVMLGLGEHELGDTADDWFARVHDDDIASVKDAVNRHIRGETQSLECEYRIRHKDGSQRWVLCRGMALRDSHGKAFRLTGAQIDITARRNAEEELRRALGDLQFALASEKVLMEELDKKNRELTELSITDGLTGLFNHRFLQERFDFEFKRVKRYGGSLSCMMIDIDHFKVVNDTYGHQFGDVVLRDVATIVTKNSREVDICGRYGGEEFIVLSNQPVESAMKHATKVHAAIDRHAFSCEGRPVHVTVSIGVSEFRNDVRTKQELIDRADTALYEAKEAGRNLIRMWKEVEGDETIRVDKYGVLDLKAKFIDLSDRMRATYMESTNALVKAVEAKDPHTQRHAENVADLAVKVSRQLRLPEADTEIIKYAALLHDVGKIGVSQSVLIKKEPLSDAEIELLKKHPVVGVNILKDVRFLEKELPIILHHHERYDGSGYPHGLKGREIPVGAAILAVVDAFDAMTAGRNYRGRVTPEKALGELIRGKGTQFSPEVVDAFAETMRK